MTRYNKRLPHLYVNEDEDGKRAKELLDQHGIKYQEIVNGRDTVTEKGWELPSVISGDGWFVGRDGIMSFVELTADLDKALVW